MLTKLLVILGIIAATHANTIQVEDPSQVKAFRDETQINFEEENTIQRASDCVNLQDISECENKCPKDYDYEKQNGCGYVSCTCVRNELGLFEGDMLMSQNTRRLIHHLYGREIANVPQERGLISQEELYWPGNGNSVIIPYTLDSSLPNSHRTVIQQAIDRYQAATCIRFVSRTTQSDYIRFFRGQGCYSYIGNIGGGQEISIGNNCDYLGIALHEIMHALGFFHEQSRPDRDQYIRINTQNIVTGREGNFEIAKNINSRGSPYDLKSVMHYGEHAFSRNGQPTIHVFSGASIGQRDDFSTEDINQINKVYCGGNGGGGVTTTAATTTRRTTTTRQTTTRRTTTRQTTTAPSGSCSNLQSANNCNYWANKGYCKGVYAKYMAKNCEKRCGLCEGGVVVTTTEAPCTDKFGRQTCSAFKRSGFCYGRYASWMMKYCSASCDGCGSSETTTVSTTKSTTTSPAQTVTSDQCGMPAIFDQSHARIVGGIEAEPGTIPWQVSIRYGRSNVPICGASLIARQWILTAAHCVKVRYTKYYSAYLGLHKKFPDGSGNERLVKFSEIIRHPQYSNRTMKNDIALIKLESPIEYTTYIMPVCLSTSDPAPPARVVVSGWGETRTGYEQNKVLLKVELPIVDNDQCDRWVYKGGRSPRITENMMCAGLADGGKDSCQGDSGGPLTYRINKYAPTYQVGVVSWGYGCARRNSPGVYTRVSKYRNWIQSTMQG